MECTFGELSRQKQPTKPNKLVTIPYDIFVLDSKTSVSYRLKSSCVHGHVFEQFCCVISKNTKTLLNLTCRSIFFKRGTTLSTLPWTIILLLQADFSGLSSCPYWKQ